MEEFRQIKNFENYEISNKGNVINKITNKILKSHVDTSGYYIVKLSKNNMKKTFRLHRLIAIAFVDNPENKQCVDHINNNRIDNSIDNLRWATKQENSQNQKLSIKNTSGFKGVTFCKDRNKWMAFITIDGILINLGRYDTIEDAKEARIKKAHEVFGVYINACEK